MARKGLSIILALLLVLAALSGCKSDDEQNTLTIQYGRNIPYTFIEGLEAEFPEIDFSYDFYQGANYTEYINSSLSHGEAADVVVHSVCLNEKESKAYWLDLSGYTFLGNFDNAIMNTMARAAHIYQIPGPASTRCIFYNKTLFEMNGWKAPSSYSELLALVKQIRTEQPDITPIAMSMIAPGYPFTIVTSLAQCGFLSTPAGAEWEERYFRGEASVAEGFDEGFTMVEQLIDANAFDGERYTNKWNVVSGDACERRAAMAISLSGTLPVLPLLDKTATAEAYGQYCTDEFGLLPFFGLNDGQEGLSITLSSVWGVNKRLEEKGNEKKLENALKVMEFISSIEGQMLLQTDNGQIPTIKNLKNTNVHPEILELWKLNDSGRKTSYLYSGYEDIMVDGGSIIAEAMFSDSSAGMREKFIETCDSIHQKELQGETAVAVYGKIEENLSVDQTVRIYMAAVQEQGKGDFMLATYRGIDNGAINSAGVGGRFFKGEVTEMTLNIVLTDYGSTIVTAELTGAEVKELLQNGKMVITGEREGHFDYIAYGLDVTKKDGAITGAKLNGEELEDDKTYTVNFTLRDYDRVFEESHTINDTGILIFDAISQYFAKHKPITAEMIP